MLSRAFTKSVRKSPRIDTGESSCRSVSIYDYEDCIFGFMDIDVPLILCEDEGGPGGDQLTFREVLRGSVGVMGAGRLGMTEKIVLSEGRVWAVKRFRKAGVRKGEFGRRIQRLAEVSQRCRYLVPVTGYLYAKRIKFVVSDYYPMGSLADLLDGARDLGHTALVWNQRLTIIQNIAWAIAFIHSQSPSQDKRLQLNVHGNVKASNVMINVDFTACLSDYGCAQLAERVKVSDTWQRKPPPPGPQKKVYCEVLCQTSDIYNFGIIMLDLLGGTKAPSLRDCIMEKIEEIKSGNCDFFEGNLEGKEQNQALIVLDLALACTHESPEARPSIERIVIHLGNVIGKIRE
ncbi:inactive leucine-rich repeat receptor-like serine/threonine-protein kinase At1g60630 [Actinidia eriantha]|uniref:inactive leucine-rich repeat receptor-like serine/threonine-protein kinase At1g60630 n=1 Tax=Actinidia eriantha TaxID=165200 RepID=UPI002588263F|nr:inactive leucine-rich repeat receptor-like serine/threonine-protein kinase At1g60630 [Actinidia eriantha]